MSNSDIIELYTEKLGIITILENKEKYYFPNYNDEDRWKPHNKQHFLKQIFQQSKGPTNLHIKEENNGKFEVCDGQNRLKTIFEFYNNKLEYQGQKYSDLGRRQKDNFLTFILEIKYYHHTENGKKIFQMVNSNVPPSDSTKRGGDDSHFQQAINENKFLIQSKKPNKDYDVLRLNTTNNPPRLLVEQLFILELEGPVNLNKKRIEKANGIEKDEMEVAKNAFKNNIELLKNALVLTKNSIEKHLYLDLYLFISKDIINYTKPYTNDIHSLIEVIIDYIRKYEHIEKNNLQHKSFFTHEEFKQMEKYMDSFKKAKGIEGAHLAYRNQTLTYIFENIVKKKN